MKTVYFDLLSMSTRLRSKEVPVRYDCTEAESTPLKFTRNSLVSGKFQCFW
jgi:hypothetical protein